MPSLGRSLPVLLVYCEARFSLIADDADARHDVLPRRGQRLETYVHIKRTRARIIPAIRERSDLPRQPRDFK